MIDNHLNNIDNSIDNATPDIDTQIESVVDEYSEAIKKLAESIILNPDDQSKWLDAQSLIQVPLKQAIKALLIQSKIDELELHKTEWVEITDDGQINPSVVHDRIAKLKEEL